MHIGTVDQLTIGGLGGEVAEMLCLLIFVDARFCSESHQFFAHACFFAPKNRVSIFSHQIP